MQNQVRELSFSLKVVKGDGSYPFRPSDLRRVITFAVNQTLIWDNLAVFPLERMLTVVGHLHNNAPFAAGPQIDVANSDLRPIAAPPLPDMLRLRPSLEYKIAWIIKNPHKLHFSI